MKNAQNMIDAGKPLKEIFDEVKPLTNGLTLVKMNDKYNVINNGRLMLTKWLDYVDDFHDGFARVELNDKANFIDKNGKLLSEQWFGYAGNFSDGFAWVQLNDKYNFIDKMLADEAEYLKDTEYDTCKLKEYVDQPSDYSKEVPVTGNTPDPFKQAAQLPEGDDDLPF